MAQTLGSKFKLLKGPFSLINSYGAKGDNDIYFATDRGIIKTDGVMIGAHAVKDASILAGTNTLQINFIDGTDTSVDLSGINLAQTLKNELIGESTDSSTDDTIYGAKKYAEDFTKAYVDASISDLDVADISTPGQAIIAVGETDGKIHATAGNIAAANVTIADASNKFTAETVEAALAELASGAATYSFTKVTSGLATNVKEAWQLVETKNGTPSNVAGSLINIYKDSALLGVKVSKHGIQWSGNDWGADPTDSSVDVLALAYEDKNGAVQVVELNVGDFLRESEFKDGLQVTNNEVSVKIDESSEGFLTVSGNGVKLAGVQSAIDTAKNNLIGNDGDSLDSNPSALTLKSLKNKVLNLNGIDVKIASGYAKADTATDVSVNDTVNVAFGKVEKQIDSLGADAVKTVHVNGQNATVANNDASVTINGSHITVTGYTKGSAEAIAATDTVNGALGKLESKADANKAAIDILNGTNTTAGSVAKSIKDAIEGLDVSDTSVANEYVAEVSETDGKISVVRAAIPVIGVQDASEGGKVAINATLDANSKVSTEKANLTSITLTGYSTDGVSAADVEATDTLGAAIAKIEAMLSWTEVTA